MKTIYSIVIFCLIFSVQNAWAGKIYRWTDAEGNVHFSSTPGPDQSADAHQGNTTKSTRRNDYAAEDIFTGDWHGSSRTLSIKLKFAKKSDSLHWEGRPRGGGVAAENFSAKWKYINSDLELFYVNHKEKPEKSGTKELVKIIEKSPEAMLLQFPNGKVFKLHKRIKRKSLNGEERNYIGKWELNDKQKTQWNLTRRGFVIKGIPFNQYNPQTLASGNWKVEGDKLVLTHLNDRYMWNKANKTGKVEKFSIVLQEQGKIILQPTGNGPQVVLNRKR